MPFIDEYQICTQHDKTSVYHKYATCLWVVERFLGVNLVVSRNLDEELNLNIIFSNGIAESTGRKTPFTEQ